MNFTDTIRSWLTVVKHMLHRWRQIRCNYTPVFYPNVIHWTYHTTGYVLLWATISMPNEEQDLFTIPERLTSPTVLWWCSFCVVFSVFCCILCTVVCRFDFFFLPSRFQFIVYIWVWRYLLYLSTLSFPLFCYYLFTYICS